MTEKLILKNAIFVVTPIACMKMKFKQNNLKKFSSF